ncbi:hypothetical protein F5B17DRAFT_267859 [Nemania serpens]|nr:hypothetical protein F5B17DRAFT_267859 [Nemania serpens]
MIGVGLLLVVLICWLIPFSLIPRLCLSPMSQSESVRLSWQWNKTDGEVEGRMRQDRADETGLERSRRCDLGGGRRGSEPASESAAR